MEGEALVIVYLVGTIIGIVIYYQLLIGAVAAGMKKTNEKLDQQRTILLKMLPKEEADKLELEQVKDKKKARR